jgi:molybdopterin synthase sulfur carrier subunit
MEGEPGRGHGVTVRYWAGARAAAGVASDEVSGATVAEVVAAAVARRPALRPVAEVATFLVDGAAAAGDRPVAPGATVEVLPPFAGG